MLPTTQEYKISLMIGEDSFRTLKDVEVIPNPNYPAEPWFSTGGLAIVFKIKVKEKLYALKCFYTEANERQERLGFISSYLKQHSSPYFVDFTYLDDELWVETVHGGGGYPVVLMEWIEGKTLDNYLEGVCKRNDKVALKNLYFQFCNLAWWLQQQPIAHGDLKHDNLIVTPEGKLKLIDYDGMFVPALVGRKANELGSPCYQHPQRDTYFFNKDLDDFSLLILQITLLALQHEPSLFAKHYNGDGILLKDTDYRNFSASSIKTTLWQLPEVKLPLLLSQVQANLSQLKVIDLMPLIQDVEWINWLVNGQNDEKLEFERKRLKFILRENTGDGMWRWKRLFINQVSLNYSLNERLIERYADKWDRESLRLNKSLSWSIKLIEKYGNKCGEASTDEDLPWTVELIEKYQDKLNWVDLSSNKYLPWTIELIEKFKDKWNWYRLSSNIENPWSIEFIDKFKNEWKWEFLSENETLPWSIKLIEAFNAKWNWKELSKNKSLPWTIKLIETFKVRWNWKELSENKSLPWSLELLEAFKDEWDWKYLSNNSSLPWSIELVEKYENSWDFESLSRNRDLPWSIELIEKYEDSLNWENLSRNISLPWSDEFIHKYENKWDWLVLSGNKSLPWSIELIEKYKNRWKWGNWVFSGLSRNSGLPWSMSLIEKYENNWDWDSLSSNMSLPWDIELITKFEDKWCWSSLTKNNALPWSENLLYRFFNKWYWGEFSEFGDFGGIKEYEGLSSIEDSFWTQEIIKESIDLLDWCILSKNKSIPWSVTFIDTYTSKWSHHKSISESFFKDKYFNDSLRNMSWERLSRNTGVYEKALKPLLNDEFIDEIMAEI